MSIIALAPRLRGDGSLTQRAARAAVVGERDAGQGRDVGTLPVGVGEQDPEPDGRPSEGQPRHPVPWAGGSWRTGSRPSGTPIAVTAWPGSSGADEIATGGGHGIPPALLSNCAANRVTHSTVVCRSARGSRQRPRPRPHGGEVGEFWTTALTATSSGVTSRRASRYRGPACRS